MGEYLDEQVNSIAAFLERKGRPSAVDMNRGKGALYEWEGKNPRDITILARASVAVFDDQAVALAALGHKEKVAARDAALRKMFGSFGFGKGEADPKLARAWTFVDNVTVANDSFLETAWLRAQYGRETAGTLELRADGTWKRTDVSQVIMGASGIWLDTGRQEKIREGKWCAGNGRLYLMFKDDSWTIYQYKLEGTELRLICDGKGEIWKAK